MARTISLKRASSMLAVHPRTILRAVTGKQNPYWVEDHDERISLEALIDAYKCTPRSVAAVLRGQDSFMSAADAATFLGINRHTFTWRKYRPAARHKGTVRYLESRLINEHMRKWM